MYLIVGLGNIGHEYEKTRHNAGFDVLDLLQMQYLDKYNFSQWQENKKFHGIISDGTLANEKIIFLKPSTFMNLSGDAVAAVTHFYQIPSENIIVISDDSELDPGRIRIRSEGGHGGHNGLRSIIASLGTDQFIRIRTGVGRHEQMNLADFVLAKMNKNELEEYAKSIRKAARAVEAIVFEGIETAQNIYN